MKHTKKKTTVQENEELFILDNEHFDEMNYTKNLEESDCDIDLGSNLGDFDGI